MVETATFSDIVSALTYFSDLLPCIVWLTQWCPPHFLLILAIACLLGGTIVLIVAVGLLLSALSNYCLRRRAPDTSSRELEALDTLRLSSRSVENLQGVLSLCSSTARADVIRSILDANAPSCMEEPSPSPDRRSPWKRR